MTNVAFVVPAAGEGRRMQATFPGVPKALIPLCGRPMIHHVLDTIAATKLGLSTVVVVNQQNEHRLRNALEGRDIEFAIQRVPRGTGDAVRSARPSINDLTTTVAVVFADQPLLSSDSISRLFSAHQLSEAAVTMAILRLKDFSEGRSAFYDWGRIIRDDSGAIVDIVEIRNATPAQLSLTEVNPSLYCFKAPWIWDALDGLSTDNAQGEYLLTDVISIAVKRGLRIASIDVQNPLEVMGANTPEQLKALENVYHQMTGHGKGCHDPE